MIRPRFSKGLAKWSATALSICSMALVCGAGRAAEVPASPPASAGGPPAVAPDFATRTTGRHLSIADMPTPRRFETRHDMVIGGRKVAYTARAEETYITNIEGEPVGRFFTFSYLRDGAASRDRPVLFIFNGGPGSASLWLHMGALGPKRAFLDKGVNPSSVPPFGLVDNDHSPLDVADLVFIDPIGTGFSHAVGAAQDADFAGIDADADSVARFIEAWLTRNKRYTSPKFVLGESYGGYRASVLPRALMGGISYGGTMRGITLDGVIIVGSPIGLGASPPPSSATVDRSVGGLIPGMVLTAHYHKLLPDAGMGVPALYDAAATFARTDYADAVHRMRQGTLSQDEQLAMADRLAHMTALPANIWIGNKLEINQPQYGALALAGAGLDVGLYDTRYTLPSLHNGGDFVADDPAMAQYVPGIVAAFHEMLSDQLQVEMPIPYEAIVWEGVYSRWNFRRTAADSTHTYADDLAIAMRRQPRLRVMLMSGYYDLLATPMAMSDAARNAELPADRVVMRTFESGHMAYLGGTAGAFADDVRNFILATLRDRGTSTIERSPE